MSRKNKKLALNRETVRTLSGEEMFRADGGVGTVTVTSIAGGVVLLIYSGAMLYYKTRSATNNPGRMSNGDASCYCAKYSIQDCQPSWQDHVTD